MSRGENKYFTPNNSFKKDQEVVVRQFVLSLVGEVAKYCPKLVFEYIEHYAQNLMLNMIVQNPDEDPESNCEMACNNATFSVGEFAIAFPNEFSPYVSDFAIRICDIMESGYVV